MLWKKLKMYYVSFNLGVRKGVEMDASSTLLAFIRTLEGEYPPEKHSKITTFSTSITVLD